MKLRKKETFTTKSKKLKPVFKILSKLAFEIVLENVLDNFGLGSIIVHLVTHLACWIVENTIFQLKKTLNRIE